MHGTQKNVTHTFASVLHSITMELTCSRLAVQLIVLKEIEFFACLFDSFLHRHSYCFEQMLCYAIWLRHEILQQYFRLWWEFIYELLCGCLQTRNICFPWNTGELFHWLMVSGHFRNFYFILKIFASDEVLSIFIIDIVHFSHFLLH